MSTRRDHPPAPVPRDGRESGLLGMRALSRPAKSWFHTPRNDAWRTHPHPEGAAQRPSRGTGERNPGVRAALAAGLALAMLASPTLAQDDLDARLATLEARVQAQEDVEEIRQLIFDYGRFLDARDFEAYANLFAEDGAWVGGFGGYEGREAIYEGMLAAFGPSSEAEWSSNFHVLGNEIITVDGDAATAVSRWMFTRPGANGAPEIILAGRYLDDLVREDGAWRFRRREALNDMVLEGFP